MSRKSQLYLCSYNHLPITRNEEGAESIFTRHCADTLQGRPMGDKGHGVHVKGTCFPLRSQCFQCIKPHIEIDMTEEKSNSWLTFILVKEENIMDQIWIYLKKKATIKTIKKRDHLGWWRGRGRRGRWIPMSWSPAWSVVLELHTETPSQNKIKKKRKRDHTKAEENKVSAGIHRAQAPRPRRAEHKELQVEMVYLYQYLKVTFNIISFTSCVWAFSLHGYLNTIYM